jgi:enoyl-[acyl-carrier protein] reductase III
MNLAGKTALITGGSRGIGRAVALRLASMGADVAICYLTSRAKANETTKDIERLGGKAKAYRVNVGNNHHIGKLLDHFAKDFGSLDILVSNAAVGVLKPAVELSSKEWNRPMGTNAEAFLHLAAGAARLMEGKHFGRILAITSMGSTRYIPNYAAVGASKAALEALTRYLAVELAPKGITVNAISSGVVDTNSLSFFPDREKMLQESKLKTPMGRLTTPEDIADLVALFCMEASGWVTGQVITADGGYSLMS